MNYHTRAQSSWYFLVTIAVFISGVLAFYLYAIWPVVRSIISSNFFTNQSCDCQSLLSFSQHPFLNIFFLASFLLVVVWFLYAAVVVAASFWRSRKMIRDFSAAAHNGDVMPGRLQRLIAQYNLQRRVFYVSAARAQLFTIGWLRAKIIISHSALRLLNDRQLEASLLHEIAHLQHHDAAKLGLLSILEKIFGWLPLWRQAAQKFRAYTEFAADTYAVQRHGSGHHLAQALFRFLETGARITPAEAHFASLPQLRLSYILENRQLRYRAAGWLPLLVLVFFVVGIVLFFAHGHAVLATIDPNAVSHMTHCPLAQANGQFFSPVPRLGLQSVEIMSQAAKTYCSL